MAAGSISRINTHVINRQHLRRSPPWSTHVGWTSLIPHTWHASAPCRRSTGINTTPGPIPSSLALQRQEVEKCRCKETNRMPVHNTAGLCRWGLGFGRPCKETDSVTWYQSYPQLYSPLFPLSTYLSSTYVEGLSKVLVCISSFRQNHIQHTFFLFFVLKAWAKASWSQLKDNQWLE